MRPLFIKFIFIHLLFVSRPIHTQRIPANVKDVIIGDINGDGSTELVISLTDRVVSADQSEATIHYSSQSEACVCR